MTKSQDTIRTDPTSEPCKSSGNNKFTGKIFGIGMSKTGTTTLGDCLEILGFRPRKGFDPQLKKWVLAGKDLEKIFTAAAKFRSFEDSPWYLLYKELDQRFPGSKFILTIRKDSGVHSVSSWFHGVRGGTRRGAPDQSYLEQKEIIYQKHNKDVLEYFEKRPDSLLTLCWEDGDGWEKLCPFLGVAIPRAGIPHSNAGRSRFRLPSFIANSTILQLLRRLFRFVRNSSVNSQLKLLKRSITYSARPKNS